MGYCTFADVRAIVDTDVTDAEIDVLIDEVGALMDMKLSTASIPPLVLRAINRTWTAIRCMLKDPSTQALGEYREDRRYALEKLNKELKDMIRIAGGSISFVYDYEAVPQSYVAST